MVWLHSPILCDSSRVLLSTRICTWMARMFQCEEMIIIHTIAFLQADQKKLRRRNVINLRWEAQSSPLYTDPEHMDLLPPPKKHEKMCYSCVCEMVLFIFLATHLIITPQFYSFIRCFQRYLLPWPTNESTTRPDIRTSSSSRTLLFICSRAVSCDFEWSSPATVARWRMRTENHANS